MVVILIFETLQLLLSHNLLTRPKPLCRLHIVLGLTDPSITRGSPVGLTGLVKQGRGSSVEDDFVTVLDLEGSEWLDKNWVWSTRLNRDHTEIISFNELTPLHLFSCSVCCQFLISLRVYNQLYRSKSVQIMLEFNMSSSWVLVRSCWRL